MAPEVKPSKDR